MIYYCEKNDIGLSDNELLRLCDDNGAGYWDDNCQQKFDNIRKASTDIINSYAVKKYQVPFENVPGTIRDIAALITRYKLLALRNAASEQVRKDYEDVIRFLEKLSRNEVGILEIDQENDTESKIKPKARIFSNRSKDDRKFFADMPGY